MPYVIAEPCIDVNDKARVESNEPRRRAAHSRASAKQVTVLFADLKGSMELLADRDPEEARKILDPVQDHADVLPIPEVLAEDLVDVGVVPRHNDESAHHDRVAELGPIRQHA